MPAARGADPPGGNAGFWPGQSSLLAGLTEGAKRHAAYAMQRVVMNLGIGIGGLIGGVVAGFSFELLFLLDAASFLGFMLVLQLVPDPELPEHEEAPGGYREPARPGKALAFMSLLWAASWLLVGAAGWRLETGAAALAFGVAVVVFAVGVTLQGPV